MTLKYQKGTYMLKAFATAGNEPTTIRSRGRNANHYTSATHQYASHFGDKRKSDTLATVELSFWTIHFTNTNIISLILRDYLNIKQIGKMFNQSLVKKITGEKSWPVFFSSEDVGVAVFVEVDKHVGRVRLEVRRRLREISGVAEHPGGLENWWLSPVRREDPEAWKFVEVCWQKSFHA